MNDFDPILDKVIKGRLNVDDVIKRHRRVRRSVTKNDTIEHVTRVMEDIEEELDSLKVILVIKCQLTCNFRYVTKNKFYQ